MRVMLNTLLVCTTATNAVPLHYAHFTTQYVQKAYYAVFFYQYRPMSSLYLKKKMVTIVINNSIAETVLSRRVSSSGCLYFQTMSSILVRVDW